VNGCLAASGNAAELADALANAFNRKWDARRIAATATGYTWRELAARNLAILSQARFCGTTHEGRGGPLQQ
jgi:hypothetical protein